MRTFDFQPFTMAFQPIVDVSDGMQVFAYEALVRGADGASAMEVLSSLREDERLAFDAACRRKAVEMASFFNVKCRLSLNISAAAICHYRYGLHATLKPARDLGWSVDRLIFEMTEIDPVSDPAKLVRWMAAARNRGVTVAIDDLGSGYSTLLRFLDLRPSLVKLDKELVRNIDTDRTRQSLVRGIVDACARENCRVVAEGVETRHEYLKLVELKIALMQGYLFARPAIASLPMVNLPAPHRAGSEALR